MVTEEGMKWQEEIRGMRMYGVTKSHWVRFYQRNIKFDSSGSIAAVNGWD